MLDFSPATRARLAQSDLRVVVTGGTGWLGLATLEMLESTLGSELASRVHVFASSRRSMTLRSGTRVDVFPLDDLSHLEIGPHLVAHYAFATRELVAQMGLSHYVARNEGITELVADHVNRSRPLGVLALSSGAVYLGSDLTTNPYGVLKARAEERFLDRGRRPDSSESSSRVVVPRLFNLAGPFLNKPDHYVLGSIIRDVAHGGPIRLHATRPVVRSYVHVRSLLDLCFALMLGDMPVPVAAFDTAGAGEIEVGALAEMVASVMGHPGMEIIRPPLDGTEADRYVGDPRVMKDLAHSYGIDMLTLSQQIEDTALSLTADGP
jgi:UDP-glucuronate decarboxylase